MKVRFYPTNEEFDIEPNQSVLDLAQKNGVFIKTICNGNASCAECRVNIKEGEANVLPPTAKEMALVGTGYFVDQRRLACQVRCFGDVVIDIEEQIARKDSGPKKIIGNRRMEEGSHAATEMIMKEDHDLVEQVEARAERQAKKGNNRNRNNNKSGGKNKNRSRGGRNRNRNRNKPSGGGQSNT